MSPIMPPTEKRKSKYQPNSDVYTLREETEEDSQERTTQRGFNLTGLQQSKPETNATTEKKCCEQMEHILNNNQTKRNMQLKQLATEKVINLASAFGSTQETPRVAPAPVAQG